MAGRMIVILVGVMLMMATQVSATTVVTKMDGGEVTPPSYGIGVTTPDIEIWGFGLNKPNPTIEIGRLFPLKTGDGSALLLGGYLSCWRIGTFAEPFVYYEKPIGNCRLSAEFFAYVPLGYGPHVIGSSGTSLTVPTGKNLRVGLTSTFWNQSGFRETNYGPLIKYSDKDISVMARYLPFGHGKPVFRIQIGQNF